MANLNFNHHIYVCAIINSHLKIEIEFKIDYYYQTISICFFI